jgi:hypothetical protein
MPSRWKQLPSRQSQPGSHDWRSSSRIPSSHSPRPAARRRRRCAPRISVRARAPAHLARHAHVRACTGLRALSVSTSLITAALRPAIRAPTLPAPARATATRSLLSPSRPRLDRFRPRARSVGVCSICIANDCSLSLSPICRCSRPYAISSRHPTPPSSRTIGRPLALGAGAGARSPCHHSRLSRLDLPHDGCSVSLSAVAPVAADGPHAPLHLADVAFSVHLALAPAAHPLLISASAWSSTARTASVVHLYPLAPPRHPCATLPLSLSRPRIGLVPAHAASFGPRSLLSTSAPPSPPRQLAHLPHNSICRSAGASSSIAPPLPLGAAVARAAYAHTGATA